MERPQSDLGSLSQELLLDLERVRPGGNPELPQAELIELIKRRTSKRLIEIFHKTKGPQ